MQAKLRGKRIQLQFRFNRNLVEDIQRLTKGKLLMSKESTPSKIKLFTPNTKDIKEGLLCLGFDVSGIPDFIDPELQNVLKYPMYPYQVGGVNFLLKRKGRGIIADEMGLGKTIQAIGWLKHTNNLPAIVVCPACVKWNWKEEIHKFTGWKSQVLESKSPSPITEDIVIVNYDILFPIKKKNPNTGTIEPVKGTGWKNALIKYKAKTIIMDEGHYLKGRNSQRLKACRALTRNIPNIIITTGTPVENSPEDLWSLLNILNPKEFNAYWVFARRYCGYKPSAYGWKPVGKKRLDLLHKVTRPYMIRRKKKEVLKDLPAMRRHVVEFSVMDKEYDRALKECMNKTNISNFKEFKNNMERLKIVAVKAKLKQVQEWIENYLESGEKLVVFGIHKEPLAKLHEGFKGSMLVDGSTPAKKRHEMVKQFQEDNKCNLLFGNIQALGTGVNGLQHVCSTAVFFELDWIPMRHEQAESRVHRNGQLSSVDIYYLITNGVEKHIMETLDNKIKEISKVTDGVEADTEEMFLELYESMKKKGFWNE